jgi:type IV pilus assembly protein PilY1
VTFSANGGDRFNLYKSILAFDAPNNNTPTRRAVYRLGHQFTRVKNALTSDGVADTSPPILLECQANAGMLFTDGYINDDNAGLPAVGNVDAGLVSNANTTPTSITLFGSAPFTDAQSNTMADITAYFYQQDLVPTLPKGKVPTDAGCPNNKLDCNPNLHMQFYGIPLGAVGKFYDKVVGGISYVDNLNTAADEATTQAFANPPAWAGSGACNSCGGTTDLTPPAVDDIWHAAINSRGKFISAQSPAAVRAGIQTVIASLLAASLPSGSLPVVGVRLGAGSLAYTPSFAKAGNDWTGDIVANTILSDGTAGPQVWDAAAQIKALSNINRDGRKIVIDTSPGSAAGHVSQYFDQSNVSAFGATESAQLTFFGINPATFHAIYGAGLTTNDVVNYLKGDDSNEVGQPSGVFRTRSTVLGDIINSQPAISSANDDFGFQGLTSTDGGGAAGAYATFLASKASRVPSVVAYVGANDGMLHAFNGTATGGQELFGFIPNSVAGTLGALINPNYVHDFYVDGGLTVFDACTSGPAGCSVATNWKTVLAGTPGAGGSGVFALDVSSPSAFPQTGSKVMWDLTGASSADIGINVGTPQVILGEDDIWYVAFGNGFNSTNSNPALVLVNLGTGAITKVLTGNDGGTFDNGIGQIIAADLTGDLVTGGPDGKVDTIYGGDYRGNVWKFDLSSTSSAGWIVAYGNVPLFVAKDKLGNVQPITGGFEISDGPVGGVMLYFGTGSFFLTTDNNVGTPPLVQTLYAIWDNGFAETTGRGTGLTGANALVAQTITANNATSPATRSTSSNTVSYTSAPLSTDRGFFMDLQVGTTTPVADGEKFFGNPIIQNGIVFYTTFEPSGDQCNPGGQRWEYGLDALSGVNALSQINFGNASGCPSGNCGAISLGNGAPIRSVSILVPPSVPANPNQTCTPGVGSCPIPSKYICDVNGNNCVLRPILTDQDLYTACTIIVKTQSSTPPGVLPRPCGRQSWRQVR